SWHPNTTASLDDRLNVIDSMLERAPEITWKLLLELLPKDQDIGSTSAEPRWRVLPDKGTMTWGEVWRANEQIINRTLNQAALRSDRLCQIVDRLGSWTPEQRTRFASRVIEFANSCGDAEPRLAVWRELRDFIGRSRTYRFIEESELQVFDQA